MSFTIDALAQRIESHKSRCGISDEEIQNMIISRKLSRFAAKMEEAAAIAAKIPALLERAKAEQRASFARLPVSMGH